MTGFFAKENKKAGAVHMLKVLIRDPLVMFLGLGSLLLAFITALKTMIVMPLNWVNRIETYLLSNLNYWPVAKPRKPT